MNPSIGSFLYIRKKLSGKVGGMKAGKKTCWLRRERMTSIKQSCFHCTWGVRECQAADVDVDNSFGIFFFIFTNGVEIQTHVIDHLDDVIAPQNKNDLVIQSSKNVNRGAAGIVNSKIC